jgi:hypothetical protein
MIGMNTKIAKSIVMLRKLLGRIYWYVLGGFRAHTWDCDMIS